MTAGSWGLASGGGGVAGAGHTHAYLEARQARYIWTLIPPNGRECVKYDNLLYRVILILLLAPSPPLPPLFLVFNEVGSNLSFTRDFWESARPGRPFVSTERTKGAQRGWRLYGGTSRTQRIVSLPPSSSWSLNLNCPRHAPRCERSNTIEDEMQAMGSL